MFKANKSLGQNFLMEFGTSQRMVDALKIESGDLIVEIGPGLGALTEILVERATEVDATINAIELDERFFKKLGDIFADKKNFNLIHASILDYLPEFFPGRDFKILGSIPYYITSPILHEIIRHKGDVEICVLMVQKEVAQKVTKLMPDASYLSTIVNSFYKTSVLENVPKEFFKPIPKVDSAVLLLTRSKTPLVSYEKIDAYEGFLHKVFAKPRKMLNKVLDKDLLARFDVDPKLRPQHVPIEKWAEIFNSQ